MIPYPMSTSSLAQARDWLRENVEEGVPCPCCSQFAKVYRRKINSTMARTIVTLYREAGHQFAHGPSLPGDTHEISQLAWWGLVEEESTRREDGGRKGWWRLTQHGVSFVRGEVRIPKYARVYDGRCLGYDGSQMVGIKDALGSRFNYDELMAGE